jgi:hypothetical protein
MTDERDDSSSSSLRTRDERHLSPSQFKTKVLRSNSISSTERAGAGGGGGGGRISPSGTGGGGQQLSHGIATLTVKERSRSAGPQGRQRGELSHHLPHPPQGTGLSLSKRFSSPLDSGSSVASSSSRSVSPARCLELREERVKQVLPSSPTLPHPLCLCLPLSASVSDRMLPKIMNKNIRSFSNRLCRSYPSLALVPHHPSPFSAIVYLPTNSPHLVLSCR